MDSQQSPTLKDKHFNLQKLMKVNDDLQQSVYYLEHHQQSNDDNKIVSNNRVFLILGTMASGKTVIQYYLCQDKLSYGIEESKKLPYILPQYIHNNAIIQKTPSTITTRIPNIQAIDTQTLAHNQRVLFIQIPDIKQLKPQQQSIQYLFLQKLFKQSSRLHLLIVIEQTALCDVSEMMESFECITELFDIKEQSIKQLISESMSIIVNKVSEDSEDSDVIGSLQQANDQVISQQFEQLSEIIRQVLKQDRVYIIKNSQPQIKQQHQLLQRLIKYSGFKSYSQNRLMGNILDEVINSQQIVDSMIDKLQLSKLWEINANNLYKFLIYCVDPKLFNQDTSQQNKQLIQQVRQLVDKQKIYTRRDQNFLVQSRIGYFIGHKPSDNILQGIQRLVKTIKQLKTQSQSNTLYQQTKQIIVQLTEIKQSIRLQILLTGNIDALQSFRHIQYLTNHLQIILTYIVNVLNNNIQQQQSQPQSYYYNSINKLISSLFDVIKQTFINFDLSLLSTNNKKKSKSHKNKNKIVIKRPNPTINQLREQFIKQVKSKKNNSIIDQIISLPISHFKLYLLIVQYKLILPKIDNDQQYFMLTIIIKQIAQILQFYRLYIEEIMFLISIPDWNRISIAIDLMERYINKHRQYHCYVKQRQIQFMNKLSIYAKQKRLPKLSQQINNITYQLQKQHINTSLSQQWFSTYLNEELAQSSNSPFLVIVQKAKKYQQQHQQHIQKYNQQMYMMKQKLNY